MSSRVPQSPGWRFGDLTIDCGRRLVLRGHETLAINGLSFDLLMALVDCAPNLVTPDELMKRVWPGVVVNPETLSQRVKLLRQALGDDARAPRYIAVVRGRGYRAIASVSSGAGPARSRRIPWRTLAIGLAFGGIGIVLLALYAVQSSGLLLRKASPAAEDLYLRARHLHQSLRVDRMDKAIRFYERALELDPKLAAAYVGLADALMLRRQVDGQARGDSHERVISLAQTALEIDPELGDAHAVLGRELAASFDLKGAARELTLGARASPTGEYVLRYLAQFHGCCAPPAEKAIEYARRGAALDRLNPWAETNVALASWEAHRFEEALRQIDLVLEVDPQFWVAHRLRNVVLDDLGRFDQALAGAKRTVALNDCATTRTDLAIAYARIGDMEHARQIYDDLATHAPGEYWSPTEMAMVLVALGDREGALSSLERAYRERDEMLISALHSKRLAPLANEPAFRRLVMELGQEARLRR